MPALQNAKHELFAQALAKGKSQVEAYEAAGYQARGKSAHESASRLSSTVKVRDRLAELQGRAAARAEITLAGITSDLQRLAVKAEAMEGPGAIQAARQCTMDIAKLHGLIVDHKRLTGANGGPIEFNLAGLTDEQLAQYAQLIAAIAGAASGDPEGDTSRTAETQH